MINDQNIGNWLQNMDLGHPFTIAGPCSAESEEQVIKTAKQIKEKQSWVTALRAGVWKPRTRPGSFEGMGSKALPWLIKAKAETGLMIAVEVANAEHVKQVLKYDIDILWIGARTSVNPFAVQEIADALKGTDRIVLVKNPINPDLALWIGAVERLHKAAIKNLGIIHRGFSAYRSEPYRNLPNWQIPIDFKTKYPNIPLICDPSHICGRRDCLQHIAQTALDLQFDGLMIETHHQPEIALSDAKQQVTPQELLNILNSLQVKASSFKDKTSIDRLEFLRKEINQTDKLLLQTLAERMEIVKKIAVVKKEKKVAVLQADRWKEVIEKMTIYAEMAGLDIDFVNRLFKEVHQESIRQQEKIIHKEL